ncbi:MAG: hypothetical protein AAGJ35_01880, partial [Myxococcota bacterium]
GGETTAFEAWLQTHALMHTPLHGITSVHCEVLQPVQSDYRALHIHPINPIDCRVYSAHQAKAMTLTPQTAADSILAQALHGFDFTKVLQQSYRDGVRFFVEVGPGDSCTKMLQQTLFEEPIFTFPVYTSQMPLRKSIARLLAALVVHRHPNAQAFLQALQQHISATMQRTTPQKTSTIQKRSMRVQNHTPIFLERKGPTQPADPTQLVRSAQRTARPLNRKLATMNKKPIHHTETTTRSIASSPPVHSATDAHPPVSHLSSVQVLAPPQQWGITAHPPKGPTLYKDVCSETCTTYTRAART